MDEYFFKTYTTDYIPTNITKTTLTYQKLYVDFPISDELKRFGPCRIKLVYDYDKTYYYDDKEYDFTDYEDDLYFVMQINNSPETVNVYLESLNQKEKYIIGDYYFDYGKEIAYLKTK